MLQRYPRAVITVVGLALTGTSAAADKFHGSGAEAATRPPAVTAPAPSLPAAPDAAPASGR